jgi:hypothetical protein
MTQKIEIQKNEKKINPVMTITYFKNEDGHFVCPDCNVVKKRQNSMHYHMKKHLEELDHVCKVCKKGFLQKQTLDLHVRSKHPEQLEQKQARFSCPFDDCEFSAITKGNCVIHCLRVHYQEEINEVMIIDEETKLICCTGCDDTFTSSGSFYYHCKKCLDVGKNNAFEKIKELI